VLGVRSPRPRPLSARSTSRKRLEARLRRPRLGAFRRLPGARRVRVPAISSTATHAAMEPTGDPNGLPDRRVRTTPMVSQLWRNDSWTSTRGSGWRYRHVKWCSAPSDEARDRRIERCRVPHDHAHTPVFPDLWPSAPSCDAMMTLEALADEPHTRSPGNLRPVPRRRALLLTGHSPPGWPRCGFESQAEAWLDAARHVDEKVGARVARAERGASRIQAPVGMTADGDYALGRAPMSCSCGSSQDCPCGHAHASSRPTANFIRVRRQLDRLAEEPIELVRVAHAPAATVAERLAARVMIVPPP